MWKGVTVKPGQTAFARIPWPTWSQAIERVSASRAALVASYWAMPARPWTAFVDDTLTILPPPCFAISGIANFAQKAAASRLTPRIQRQESAVASVLGP